MMSDFERALPIVLRREGGYVDDPNDRGGETNFGVTHMTYERWRKSQGLPKRSVKEITQKEVAAIYRGYWDAAKCDAMDWPVSAIHFDAAINSGPTRAVKLLQKAVGSKQDGVIGPITLSAIKSKPTHWLANELMWTRVAYYRSIAKGTQLNHLRGWLGRLIHLRADMQAES